MSDYYLCLDADELPAEWRAGKNHQILIWIGYDVEYAFGGWRMDVWAESIEDHHPTEPHATVATGYKECEAWLESRFPEVDEDQWQERFRGELERSLA